MKTKFECFELNRSILKHILVILVISVTAQFSHAQGNQTLVEQWDIFELSLNGPQDGNPFLDVALSARFIRGDRVIEVNGFYDGDGRYMIRFSPDEQGIWTYQTQSNVQQLSRKTGRFICTTPTGDNHGPLKIVNTYYLQYADGTPFYAVETTCYQWISVSQDLQNMTLRTLAQSPFKKSACVCFPNIITGTKASRGLFLMPEKSK